MTTETVPDEENPMLLKKEKKIPQALVEDFSKYGVSDFRLPEQLEKEPGMVEKLVNWYKNAKVKPYIGGYGPSVKPEDMHTVTPGPDDDYPPPKGITIGIKVSF